MRLRVACEGNGSDRSAVSDTGIGIPAGMLERVFDLFAQGRDARDRSQGGLGIGLTLVKRLVEMHGGYVRGLERRRGARQRVRARLPAARRAPLAGARRRRVAGEARRASPGAC